MCVSNDLPQPVPFASVSGPVRGLKGELEDKTAISYLPHQDNCLTHSPWPLSGLLELASVFSVFFVEGGEYLSLVWEL